MRNSVLFLLGASGLLAAACDVDTKKEGELPDVDVNATGGQLPDVDVNATGGQLPNIDVTGPDVDVGMENRTIQVPDVDVKAPQENQQ